MDVVLSSLVQLTLLREGEDCRFSEVPPSPGDSVMENWSLFLVAGRCFAYCLKYLDINYGLKQQMHDKNKYYHSGKLFLRSAEKMQIFVLVLLCPDEASW